MVSLVASQAIITPHLSDEKSDDSGVQRSPINVEVSRGNDDLEPAADSRAGTTEDGLVVAELAAVRLLEDCVDGEIRQRLPPENDSEYDGDGDGTGPELQTGCLETDDLEAAKCSREDRPISVASSMLLNHNVDDDDDSDVGVRPKLATSSEERENTGVETEVESQSTSVDDTLVTRLKGITLEGVTVDASTTETIKQELLMRGPTNGVSTGQAKFQRCSPKEADRPSGTGVTGIAGTQSSSATQQLPADPGYPSSQSFIQTVPLVNMDCRYRSRPPMIPVPFVPYEYHSMYESPFSITHVPSQNVSGTCQYSTISGNCPRVVHPTFSRPAEPVMLHPPTLPELSQDDVVNVFRELTDSDTRGAVRPRLISQRNVDDVRRFPTTDTVNDRRVVPDPYRPPAPAAETVRQSQPYFVDTSAVRRPIMPSDLAPARTRSTMPWGRPCVQRQPCVVDAMPPIVECEQPVQSWPSFDEQVVSPPSSALSPISSAGSDASQSVSGGGGSARSAADETSSVVAGSSVGDWDVVRPQRRSFSSSSYVGSPDDRRDSIQRSPSDADAMSPIPPTPLSLLVNEFTTIPVYETNDSSKPDSSAVVASFPSGKSLTSSHFLLFAFSSSDNLRLPAAGSNN